MSRNIITRALVLKQSRIGEIHKRVDLLTEDVGILDAIAHGAYKGKGKLAGVTEPFSSVIVYIYKDPVKASYKISDVDCKAAFETIRADLPRYYSASLIAEIVLKSYGGGSNSKQIFALTLGAMESLDSIPEDHIRFVAYQFLLRYIALQGFLPDVDVCNSCGKPIAQSGFAYYYRGYGVMVCDQCKRTEMEKLSPGGRAYLHYTSTQPFSRAVMVKADTTTAKELKTVLVAMSEDMVETSLNTLKTGDYFF